MALGHLLCGLVVGWLAALGCFLMGFSVAAMLGVYVLGTNVGILLSVLWTSAIAAAREPIVRWPVWGAQAR